MSTPSPAWWMWEARAADGQGETLLAWALDHAPATAQVYCSADRVVLIAPGLPEESADLADPPTGLLARPPYVWPFERVR